MADTEPLRVAKRLPVLLELDPPPSISNLEYLRLWWGNGIPYKTILIIQSIVLGVIALGGAVMVLAAVFDSDAYVAAAEPTPTSTPLPSLPTRTPVPTSTPTRTPWPTLAPQGKGKAMADISTSNYAGFDYRFGSRLMGLEPDFEEYLLCFNGTGIYRNPDGGATESTWGTWSDQSGFCMPGVFYTVSKANDILITSDVLHSIGLSEAEWQKINIHIYANGPPEGFTVFCVAGIMQDTSKFCLGD